MAQRLRDIHVNELSLVHRGANRRRFSLLKADDPGDLADDVAAVLAEKADGEDQLLKALADVDAEAGRAAVAAFRLLKAHRHDLPEAIGKAVDAMADDAEDLADGGADEAAEGEAASGDEPKKKPVTKAKYDAAQLAEMAKSGAALPDRSYPIGDKDDLEKAVHAVGRGKNNPHADIRAHITKRANALGASDLIPDSWKLSKEDPEMTDTATVPVKKEDGTWDLTGVPEAQHEFMKELLEKADRTDTVEAEKAQLEKAAADAEASKDEALKIAKEEREIRLTGVYVAKAEELGQPGEEFGPVLKAIAAAVDADTYGKLESVLKANHERAVTAGIYQEIGKSGGNGAASGAKAEMDEKVAEIRKADSGISKEQAYAKALDENPDLYARLREEG